MSYTIEECPDAWYVMEPYDRFGMSSAAAVCPTREAAEAARRLLSGECARAKWPAAFFASVESALAKEEPPLPVCGVCSGGVCSEWCGYEAGKADGAAQERAKIVKWLTLHGQLSLAKFIERGEAGE